MTATATAPPEEVHGKEAASEPRWALVITLVALGFVALLLTVPHEWGRLISDNRDVFYTDPAATLRQLFRAWDPRSDLGGPPAGYAPLTVGFSSALRLAGLPAWLVERLYHAALLAIGATGTALLARRLDRSARWLPAASGAVFLASPFVVGFLLPSWLFQNAALAPWLLLAAIGGCTSRSRWRHAALFALGAATAGSLNAPAFMWAAFPLIPAIAVLVATGETTWRRVGPWVLRTAALTFLVLLPALVRVVLGAGALGRNLQTSETVAAVSQSSSWSESLRGLGSWLLYWNPAGRLLFPYASLYFSKWWVVLLTFVPVATAFAVVGLTRWKPRILLGAVLVTSAAAMVGAFPFQSPSPGGSLLVKLYSTIPQTVGLRNTYKAGGGLLFATSILAGYGFLATLAWIHRRRRWLRDWRTTTATIALGVLGAAVLLAGSWPLVTGAVYRDTKGTSSVPAYWHDAAGWLNSQEGEGRVAVYPAANSAAYRWGTVGGGDLFPALFTRAYTSASVVSSSAPDAANLLTSLDDYVTSGTYQPGTYAPIARRIGIRYVVIRNDLDWRSANTARPAAMDGLRDDPGLRLVASFGARGENVVSLDDEGPLVDLEEQLTPIEIYEVVGFGGQTRTVDSGPTMVVSGDGDAWASLAAAGELDSWTPIQYSGRLDAASVLQATESGSAIVVTDTNRRRQVALGSSGPTLPETRSVRAEGLFDVPGSQSVAVYSDATSITTVGAPNIFDPGAANRPAAAFDGSPGTAWRTGTAIPLAGQGLKVDLREPTSISSVTVIPAEPRPGDRSVTQVTVVLPDGSRIPTQVVDGRATATFRERAVDTLQVVVSGTAGGGLGPFGLAEVVVPGLDLHEVIQVPDDVRRAAAADPPLEDALRTAPVEYRFRRLQSVPVDEESSLDRRFWVIGPRAFTLSGELHATDNTDDPLLIDLLAPFARSTASTRDGDDLGASGVLATDGDPTTGWTTRPVDGSSLTVNEPNDSPSRSVEVTVDASALTRPVTAVVSDGNTLGSARIERPPFCADDGAPCPVTVSIPMSGRPSNRLVVGVSATDDEVAAGQQVTVLEVGRNRVANAPLPEEIPPLCRPNLVNLDGTTVPVRLIGTTADLLAGRTVRFESCDPVLLDDGWHMLDTGWTLPFDDVSVSPLGSDGIPVVAAADSSVDARSAAAVTIRHDGSEGLRLVSGWGNSPGWTASGDATPVELDTQAAWVLGGGSDTTRIVYRPDATYRLAVALSLLGIVVTLALLVLDPHRRTKAYEAAPPPPSWWADAVLLVAAVLVGGLAGLGVAALAVFAMRRQLVTARLLGVIAVAMLVLAAIATVPPIGAALTPISPVWPSDRRLAHTLAKLAAVTLGASMVAALHRWRGRRSSGADRANATSDKQGTSVVPRG